MEHSNPMLAKIRSLLDKADSTEFPAEAEAYRAKAEELMAKYRIEEEELIAKDPMAVLPIWGDTELCKAGPFYTEYVTMFHHIAQHCGIKHAAEWGYPSGTATIFARTVGYESDLRYAEALYTSARMVFSERLEPRLNHNMSEQENVYRLRSAGMERVRISRLMWGNEDKLNLAKVGRLYKAECKVRDEEPALSGRGVTGAAFREQYAQEFVMTLYRRLYMARDAAGRSGGGLVLHGRAERVTEEFYVRFPQRRPQAAIETDRAPAKQCEKCAVNKSGTCKEHPPVKYARSGGRDPFSVAAMRGREAGAAAARHVDLGRSTGGHIGGS